MGLNKQLVQESFKFDSTDIENIKTQWLALMELIVWGDASSKKIGALPRARKRVLEVGENFTSFISSKEWIDQPRQQIKSAVGASVKLRDSLSSLKTVVQHITEGCDAGEFQKSVGSFEKMILDFIMPLENSWAEILDSEGYE